MPWDIRVRVSLRKRDNTSGKAFKSRKADSGIEDHRVEAIP